MKFLIVFLLTLSSAYAKDIVLTSDNTVSLNEPVSDESVGAVMLELNSLSKIGNEQDPIYLILNTPGGSVSAGLDLMQYMNTLRRPVHSVANFAASMGFHILQASPIRYVTEFATVMSHQAYSSFQGSLPGQAMSRLNRVISLIEKMDEKVIARTKGKFNKKTYAALVHDEYWVIGKDTIKDGFADEVAFLKCDASLDGTVEKEIQVFIFTAKVKFSKCPLITSPIIEDESKKEAITAFLKTVKGLEL
jgi:ATP-dependent Clp protease protease subunit